MAAGGWGSGSAAAAAGPSGDAVRKTLLGTTTDRFLQRPDFFRVIEKLGASRGNSGLFLIGFTVFRQLQSTDRPPGAFSVELDRGCGLFGSMEVSALFPQ